VALRTQLFSQFPWSGGINTSVDKGLIPPNELLQADNILFDTRGSRKKRPGLNFNFDAGSYQLTKITTVADISSSLDGTTFILQDGAGSVAFWIDVDDSGTTIPSEAAAEDRAVEITTITEDMTAEEVAEEIAAAIEADPEFSSAQAGPQVYAIALSPQGLPDSEASTSGFTLSSFYSEDSPIIGIKDFWWYNASANAKVQDIAVFNTQGILTLINSVTGNRTFVVDIGTPYTNAITKVSFETFNNKLIVAVDGFANTLKFYDPQTEEFEDLPGSPVNASIVREHLGRLWYNNKEERDRLYYTTTFNHTEHNGIGDSGALWIGIGDGDPEGITAIFPTYKGDLFIAKRTKLYRVHGSYPENFQIIPVSNGIGCISHKSIAQIDQDDMFFASERGIHSLAASANFGDFEATFVSASIQREFRDRFTEKERITATYLPALNSYLFTVVDESVSADRPSCWLYNIPQKAWYRWTVSESIGAGLSSVTSVLIGSRQIAFFGSTSGRLVQNESPSVNDINSDGEDTAIEMTVRTGFIFPDGNPYTIKTFYRLGIIYSPASGSSVQFDFQVDDFEPQSFIIEGPAGGSTLGEGSENPLILGESTLAGTFNLAPHTLSVEGQGRGFILTIRQAAIDEDVEIQGFQLEYMAQGTRQQTPVTQSGDT
jgi:hypothetical protein